MPVFNEEEQQRIRKAIEEAENRSSGEIRVCIEKKCSEDVLDRVAKYFYQVNTHKTKLRHGVHIYVATVDRVFAIIGDAGIHQVVPPNFWYSCQEDMTRHFKYGDIVEANISGLKI